MTSELTGARGSLETADGAVDIYRLDHLSDHGDIARLPKTVKILLENLLRRAGTRDVSDDDVRALAAWPGPAQNIAFMPGRVLMQDLTGVPAVVDLAAMRSAMARNGGDPSTVDPLVPADLIIDHSVQVDLFRSEGAYAANIEWEYRRNSERYALLRWAQQAFDGLRVVPPGAGICHQVNLEHLGQVVTVRDGVAFPDTLVGTDSHTTMINGLGVLGWGVGGIEAEAAMLGQPAFMPQPLMVGVRMTGGLPPGTTATDLVLTLTQMLRAHGVVGRFVEFFGDGLSTLSTADRATMSNMCPEYGATAAYFPVDEETLRYLAFTGRDRLVDVVERYTKEQGLFRSDGDPDPVFTEVLDLDLSGIVPSLAGPKRPQDRVALPDVWDSFVAAFRDGSEPDPKLTEVGRFESEGGNPDVAVDVDATIEPGTETPIDVNGATVRHGSVVIAAITSCTNTSNPSVMLAAGLLAKKAVEAGLETKPWVKTSLAPGSRVVTDYLDRAGLTPYLDKLGFSLVGYGCTTCIGNSGPLPEKVASAVDEGDLNVVAVLSGNRNFEGTDPSAGEGELPRLAAALCRLRPGRQRPHRPHDRAARPGRGWSGIPQRHLALGRGRGAGDPDVARARTVRARIRTRLGRRRELGGTAVALRSDVRLGSRFDIRARAAVLRRSRRCRRRREHRGRARPGEGRRLHHHRPHLAGRIDQGGLARGGVPQGARGVTGGVQQLRRTPR